MAEQVPIEGQEQTFINEQVYIDRPPDEVFAYVVEVTNEPFWQSDVRLAEWMDQGGEIYEGRQARTVAQFLGEDVEFVAQVARYDPPNELTWQIVDGPFGMQATWRFEPQDAGTMVTMTAAKALDGMFANQGVSDPMTTEMFSRQLRAEMANLKELLEGGVVG